MLLVDTSSRHWLRLRFKQLCIQFVRFATLYSYLALYYYYICAICHPILLFGTICLLGTQEYAIFKRYHFGGFERSRHSRLGKCRCEFIAKAGFSNVQRSKEHI